MLPSCINRDISNVLTLLGLPSRFTSTLLSGSWPAESRDKHSQKGPDTEVLKKKVTTSITSVNMYMYTYVYVYIHIYIYVYEWSLSPDSSTRRYLDPLELFLRPHPPTKKHTVFHNYQPAPLVGVSPEHRAWYFSNSKVSTMTASIPPAVPGLTLKLPLKSQALQQAAALGCTSGHLLWLAVGPLKWLGVLKQAETLIRSTTG